MDFELIQKEIEDNASLIQASECLHEMSNNIMKEIYSKLDEMIVEGLKRKGYEFKTKKDLINFIKDNCMAYDRKHLKQKVFEVNNEPFLMQDYSLVKQHPEISKQEIEREIKFTIEHNYGKFYYL